MHHYQCLAVPVELTYGEVRFPRVGIAVWQACLIVSKSVCLFYNVTGHLVFWLVIFIKFIYLTLFGGV